MLIDFFRDKRTIIRVFLTLIVAFVALLTLNCGLYVDENGLLTIYKGIYQGQHMFTDSWESLQTGGILTWPAYALYYQVLSPLFTSNGINIGLVLYMRILYVLVRAIITVYLYLTIKRTSYEDGAFHAALFYFMFVVAWRNFSYKSFCEMSVMLIICFLIRYYESEKTRYFVYAGVACCIGILAYPTMILFAVAIGVLILVEMYRNRMGVKNLIAFVATCLIIGMSFILYLQVTSGLSNIISQIGSLGDQDYDHSVLYRIGMLLLSYLSLAVVAYIPVIAIWLLRKARYVSNLFERIVFAIYWFAFLIGLCAIRPDSISISRFVYALIILFFWVPYLMYEEKENGLTKIGAYNSTISNEKGLLWLIFVCSAIAQFIWSLSTNQGISVPGMMSVFGVVAVIIISESEEKENHLLVALITLAAFFFMGIWVPEKNGGYSDALTQRWIVKEGELKGIALLPEDYDKNESVYNLVSQYVTEDDYLLVAFGSNSTGYLNSVAKQGTYSVYARTQKNAKLLDYYEINPENQADYVLIDTSNIKYDDFSNGEVGKYIYQNYTNEIARDGDFVLLGR